MISLIRNEWMKIFAKASSYVFIGILVVAVIGSAFIARAVNNNNTNNDWRAEEQANIEMYKEDLANPELGEEEKNYAAEEIKAAEARLDAGVDPYKITTWTFMSDWVISFTSFVTLFAVIVCSASVSSEFSDGTIKQLLIRPHRRWKILLSKYITSLLFAGSMLVILVVAGYLTGLIFFDHGSFSEKMVDPMTYDNNMTVAAGSYFIDMVVYWIPGFIIITTIAFMLSTLFKNQSIAVGIAVFILFASAPLNVLITAFVERYEWLKYVLFPHLDLRGYITDSIPMFEGATVGFSLGVLAVYYAIFIAITFFVFKKKDISI